MKNQLVILWAILLVAVTYACKSDKVSVESKNIVAVQDAKVDDVSSKNASSSENKTTSMPMGGKKGGMKGFLPAKTFREKNGMINTITSGMVIADQTKKLVRGYIDIGGTKTIVYKLIDDKGGTLGYIQPRIGNSDLVGDITITSKKVLTRHGIRVGNNFEELLSATMNLGGLRELPSEKGGSAYVDGVEYIFNVRDVKADSKIVEILISDKK